MDTMEIGHDATTPTTTTATTSTAAAAAALAEDVAAAAAAATTDVAAAAGTTTTSTPAETAAAVVAAAVVAEEPPQKTTPPSASAEAMETVRQQFQTAVDREPDAPTAMDSTKGALVSSVLQQQQLLVCMHCQTVRKETSPVALAKHLILCYKTPTDLKSTILSGHSMFREVVLAGALVGMGPTQSSKVSVAASIHLKVEEGNTMGNIVQTCSFCAVTWAAPQFLQSKWDTHLLEQCPRVPLDLKLVIADNYLTSKPLEPQTVKKPFSEHITSVKEDENILLQTCKYCGFHRRSQNFRRPMWIHHLAMVCTKVPPAVQASFAALTSNHETAGTKRSRASVGTTDAAQQQQQPVAPKFPIRDHFNRTPQADGKVLQTCKYCEESRLSHQIQVTTWTEHMIKCTGFPMDLKLEIVKMTTSHKVLELAHARNIWPKDMEGPEPSSIPLAKKQRRDPSLPASTTTATFSMKDHVLCAPPNPIDERVLQTCKYCNTMTRNSRQFQTTKWSEHIVECPAAPLRVKQLIVATNTSVLVQRAAAHEVVGVPEDTVVKLEVAADTADVSTNNNINETNENTVTENAATGAVAGGGAVLVKTEGQDPPTADATEEETAAAAAVAAAGALSLSSTVVSATQRV